MPDFHFFHSIEVRYGDLDPQGHVNNSRYLTYMEQGRIAYLRHTGIWPGGSFLDLGVILADAQITFRAPILYGDAVRVGVCVTRLGNKSVDMAYHVDNGPEGKLYATGKSVQVAYDYHSGLTVPVPANWRQIIQAFEGLTG